jgi:hypothetical protein
MHYIIIKKHIQLALLQILLAHFFIFVQFFIASPIFIIIPLEKYSKIQYNKYKQWVVRLADK